MPLYEAIADAVSSVLADGRARPCCRATAPPRSARSPASSAQGIDPAIIWLDAHGDVQTMETTTSGFLGGMPLRLLVGYRPELVADALGLHPLAEDVWCSSMPVTSTPEVEYLDRSRIRRCAVADLLPRSVPDGPLYLHLDMDVVDPLDVPHVRYPAPRRAEPRRGDGSLDGVLTTGRVVCFRASLVRGRPEMRSATTSVPGLGHPCRRGKRNDAEAWTAAGSAEPARPAAERAHAVGSAPQIRAPFWYRVTVCVSLYTKLSSEMNE